jgi:hypothetical protein
MVARQRIADAVWFVDRTYVYDNSIDGSEAQLLFRMTAGEIKKQYTDNIPFWAAPIYGNKKCAFAPRNKNWKNDIKQKN